MKKSNGLTTIKYNETTDSSRNSVQYDLQTLKHRFSVVLGKIYELFEISKNQLRKNYESIHGIIELISFDTIIENDKTIIDFIDSLNQISGELNVKLLKAQQSIRNSVITGESLKKLIRTKSQIFRSSSQMSIDKSFHSKKQQVMNKSVSGKSLKNQQLENNLNYLDKLTPQNRHLIQKIQLYTKTIENMDFFQGEWQSLQTLTIQNKQLKQIVKFSSVKAPFLTEINLNSNEIISLSNFAQAFLPQLKNLSLQKNRLVSIEGLQQANIAQLRRLNLSNNKIKNINILPQAYFPNLIELYLTENRIQNLESLKKVYFPKLQILNIDKNNLKDISIIKECDFLSLKVLSFCHNEISNIDFLGLSSLRHLKGLYGDHNQIKSIQFFKTCNFFQIQAIVLNNNKIDNIKVFSQINLQKLKRLDLYKNNIENTQFLCFNKKNYQSKRVKDKYPFVQL